MSSSRRVPLALGALLATALTALTPTSAQAAANASPDRRGDVVAQSGARPGRVDPSRSSGDVVASRVSHGSRAVTLELRFATLRASGSWHRHWFRLVTDEGVRRELAVTAGPGSWQGRARLSGVDRSPEGCVLRSTISYGTGGTVRVVVPRACLSGPTWVRVAAGSVSSTGTTVYADDARTTGRLYDAPVFGPRVHRG